MSPDDATITPTTGLLLGRDLIFTSKITGTARALGGEVRAVGDLARARALLEADPAGFAVVLVDLAAGDLVRPDAIRALRDLAPDVPFVAFGSHVDTAALAAAAAAGCDPVLPRSRFTAELPELLRRFLIGPATPAQPAS